MSERNLQILDWIGTCLSIVIYFSYTPQIMGNLDGHKTPFIQPFSCCDKLHDMDKLRLAKSQKRLSTFCCKLARHNLWTFGNYNSVLVRYFKLFTLKIAGKFVNLSANKSKFYK